VLGSAIWMSQSILGIPFGLPAVFKVVRFFGLIYSLVAGTRLTSDCIALGWVGMWSGLKLGNCRAATRAAIIRVMTLPFLLFGLCFVGIQGLLPPVRSPYIPIGLWLGVGLAFDVLWIISTRALLYREFRNVLQEPAQAPYAWARALGRWLGGIFPTEAKNGSREERPVPF